MRPTRSSLPLLFCIVAVVAACVPASLPSAHSLAVAPTRAAMEQDLRVLPVDDPIDTHRLDQSGLAFTLADPVRVKPSITREQAIAKAWEEGPNKIGGTVIAAADLGYIDGGTMVSGLAPGRLVWFVGFTGPGIVEYSSGPPGAPHPISHEYVSIIDAISGAILTAMTCCVIHSQGVMPFESCIQPPDKAAAFSFSCQEALHRAAEASRQSGPEMGIQQARMDSLRAELMTYAEADRRLSSKHGYRSMPGQDPNELVWWVQVIGSFQFDGMAAAGSSEYPIYEAKERDYLYSAQTGREIEEIVPDTILVGHGVRLAPPPPTAAVP